MLLNSTSDSSRTSKWKVVDRAITHTTDMLRSNSLSYAVVVLMRGKPQDAEIADLWVVKTGVVFPIVATGAIAVKSLLPKLLERNPRVQHCGERAAEYSVAVLFGGSLYVYSLMMAARVITSIKLIHEGKSDGEVDVGNDIFTIINVAVGLFSLTGTATHKYISPSFRGSQRFFQTCADMATAEGMLILGEQLAGTESAHTPMSLFVRLAVNAAVAMISYFGRNAASDSVRHKINTVFNLIWATAHAEFQLALCLALADDLGVPWQVIQSVLYTAFVGWCISSACFAVELPASPTTHLDVVAGAGYYALDDDSHVRVQDGYTIEEIPPEEADLGDEEDKSRTQALALMAKQ